MRESWCNKRIVYGMVDAVEMRVHVVGVPIGGGYVQCGVGEG